MIEALRSLPETQRQTLALYYLADLSVEDIAATLGCAVGTVKSAARARTRSDGAGARAGRRGARDA